GVAHTRAEPVLFFDADDIMHPGALGHFIAAMNQNPCAAAVYAKTIYIGEHGELLGDRYTPTTSGRELFHELLERRPCFHSGSLCIRRNALEKVQNNNHNFRYGEDWVLWCHLALSGDIVFSGHRIVHSYRIHKNGVSASFAENYHWLIDALNAV